MNLGETVETTHAAATARGRSNTMARFTSVGGPSWSRVQNYPVTKKQAEETMNEYIKKGIPKNKLRIRKFKYGFALYRHR